MADAVCHGLTFLFFPEDKESSHPAAKALCATCPVRGQCLVFALDNFTTGQTDFGVWGGTSATERAVLRRQRRQHFPQSKVVYPKRRMEPT